MIFRPSGQPASGIVSPDYGLAFCLLGRAEAILLARGAGFGFAVVDMEHGPLGMSELGQMAAAGLASRFPVYGRVTGPMSPDIARVLDCGAVGVIVPHVDSVDDARRIVRACHVRFPAPCRRSITARPPPESFATCPRRPRRLLR